MSVDIVLASASPRRKQLLAQIIDDFTCIAADIDESLLNNNEEAKSLVERLSVSKAKHVQQTFTDALIIGSDTVISINNKVLGKPSDYNDFLCMMDAVSDCSHQVYTGVCAMLNDISLSLVVETQVTMGHISKEDAIKYWQSGEPQDKAGGYAIQGLGGQFVKSIQGSFSAVVGLPLYETKHLIEKIQRA